ncbi:MAG TPA: cysteine desulfurase NifS [Candidatus Limnocylindrales bacterium]|nr:cysteine desulfurase NifS [Candidatus Limnocylindrales bacterium]
MTAMRRVYFDHNATTPVDKEVLEAMLLYFSTEYGNASSIHSFGQETRAAVERARSSVAALLGAKPSEIVFTSGGTESDNLAIFGIVEGARGPRKHIITTQIEHSAALNSCQALAKRGIDVTFLPVGPDGVLDAQEVRRAIRPETVLITVMHANNEIGTLQPLEEIGRIAAEADVWFHADAVQSAGKIPLDVEKLGVDLISISAHKFYGPKGVGALFVRSGTKLEPVFHGGHHERDRRPGTENVPGIVGLGRAAELAREKLSDDAAHVTGLRDRFERGVLASVPGARVNGAGAARVPNTSNISFPEVASEALLIALDLKGLACSSGSACSSGAVTPSHVLTAIGLCAADARASLRFSLGRHTTDADVDYALAMLPGEVARLRAISPEKKKVAPIT